MIILRMRKYFVDLMNYLLIVLSMLFTKQVKVLLICIARLVKQIVSLWNRHINAAGPCHVENMSTQGNP